MKKAILISYCDAFVADALSVMSKIRARLERSFDFTGQKSSSNRQMKGTNHFYLSSSEFFDAAIRICYCACAVASFSDDRPENRLVEIFLYQIWMLNSKIFLAKNEIY